MSDKSVIERVKEAEAQNTSYNVFDDELKQGKAKRRREPGQVMAIDNKGEPVRIRMDRTMAGEGFKKLVGGDWVSIPESEYDQLLINTQSVSNAAGIPLSQMGDFMRKNKDQVKQFMQGEISSLREKPKEKQETFVTKASEQSKEDPLPQYQPEGERTELDSVARLQGALKKAGHDPGKIDGYFGDKTLKALNSFKKERGYEPDGIVTEALYTDLLAARR